MKTRLKGAQKGHSLLKKKADALSMRFRSILKQIVTVPDFVKMDFISRRIRPYESPSSLFSSHTVDLNLMALLPL